MMHLRKAQDRGKGEFSWLRARYSFSFSNYYDPQHMGFRNLRVINEDVIEPGQGFDTHPHRNMEIVTYMLEGKIQHKDSQGNSSVLGQGEIQYMSAGSGIFHSEFNPDPEHRAHLLQIWIEPQEKGTEPYYVNKKLGDFDEMQLIVSPDARDNSVPVRQDVSVYVLKLSENKQKSIEVDPHRHGWIQIAKGEVNVNGQALKAGDGLGFSEEAKLEFITYNSQCELLYFDLN